MKNRTKLHHPYRNIYITLHFLKGRWYQMQIFQKNKKIGQGLCYFKKDFLLIATINLHHDERKNKTAIKILIELLTRRFKNKDRLYRYWKWVRLFPWWDRSLVFYQNPKQVIDKLFQFRNKLKKLNMHEIEKLQNFLKT